MKIMPLLQPVAQHRIRSPVGAEGLSFAEWLQIPDRQLASPQQRAFGFSELALLGEAHAFSATGQNTAGQIATCLDSPSQEAVVDRLADASAVVTSAALTLNRAASVAGAPPRETGPVLSPMNDIDAGLSVAPAAAVSRTLSLSAQSSASTDEAGAPPNPRTRPPASAQVNLVAAELAGEWRVSAGAADLTPETTDLLRRRLVELTEEFGVSLGELQVNGLPLPLSMNGAEHGRCTG